MPRAVRKIHNKEKAKAQGLYVTEGEEAPSAKFIYPELDVVKPVDKVNTLEDNWPIHEFRHVTAVNQDGNIVNLLFCAKDGHKFTVTGQIIVDQEYENQCKSLIS